MGGGRDSKIRRVLCAPVSVLTEEKTEGWSQH